VARDQLPHALAELSTHDNQRVTKALNDGLQAALTGTKTPEQAMKDAQARPTGSCGRTSDVCIGHEPGSRAPQGSRHEATAVDVARPMTRPSRHPGWAHERQAQMHAPRCCCCCRPSVLLVAFTHFPAVATLWDSFHSTPKGNRPAVWVGLDNYQVMVETRSSGRRWSTTCGSRWPPSRCRSGWRC
jgi:hypothetical protein